MIVSIPYDFRHGGEVDYITDGFGNYVSDGNGNLIASGTSSIYIHPSSGYKTIDVILNGVSLNIGVDVEVDETTGKITFPEVLGKGDFVLAIFKQLPRYGPAYGIIDMQEFAPSEFSEEFA